MYSFLNLFSDIYLELLHDDFKEEVPVNCVQHKIIMTGPHIQCKSQPLRGTKTGYQKKAAWCQLVEWGMIVKHCDSERASSLWLHNKLQKNHRNQKYQYFVSECMHKKSAHSYLVFLEVCVPLPRHTTYSHRA